MAGRLKKVQVQPIVENKTIKKEIKQDSLNNKKSYEDLESELSEIKEMMKILINSKKEENKTKDVGIQETKSVQSEIVQDEYVEINPNKRIPVISLYDGILVLTTDKQGQGKPFVFNKFGTVHNINYTDLVEILHYQRTFAENGLFYISDKNAVSNNGLQDVYSKILSKEMIDKLLDLDNKKITDLFKNTTKAQQDIIVSIIVSKIRNEEEIDLNKVGVISKLYGKDVFEISNDIIKEEDLVE